MPVRTPGFTPTSPRFTSRAETTVRSGHPSGMHNLSKVQAAVSWLLQLVAAGILLQTLFFKFTGAAESVHIFTTLGVEPWGRIGSGVVELIASILLLVPATASIGAVMAVGVMSVAIVSHLSVLGIEVEGDGGLLFALALIVFVCGAIVLTIRRAQVPVVGHYFEVA
jgi:putative oxidoreductase